MLFEFTTKSVVIIFMFCGLQSCVLLFLQTKCNSWYLGTELNSQQRELHLPLAKLNDLMQELESRFGRRKTSKQHLLSLIGKLSFAAKVIPAGHLFLCHLIDLSTTVSQLHHHACYTKQPGLGRRSVVAPVPSWMNHVPGHNLGLGPGSPALYRHF